MVSVLRRRRRARLAPMAIAPQACNAGPTFPVLLKRPLAQIAPMRRVLPGHIAGTISARHNCQPVRSAQGPAIIPAYPAVAQCSSTTSRLALEAPTRLLGAQPRAQAIRASESKRCFPRPLAARVKHFAGQRISWRLLKHSKPEPPTVRAPLRQKNRWSRMHGSRARSLPLSDR
jgi:hypothetical protein